MTISASVQDVDLIGASIGKYQKTIFDQVHLQHRLFNIHGLVFYVFDLDLPFDFVISYGFSFFKCENRPCFSINSTRGLFSLGL